MSEKNQSFEPDRKPNLREIMRPVELIGFSAVLGIFTGLIVLLSTREILLAVIGLGLAFIVTLVVIALFALGFKPGDDEKDDLSEQDEEAQKRREQRENPGL